MFDRTSGAMIGVTSILGICGVVAAAINSAFVSFEGFVGVVIAGMLAGILAKMPDAAQQQREQQSADD